jgi:tripartite-type tricarboxylate transporter receptor subunit TctC
VLALTMQAAFAQSYPTRAVRIIVPYAPGGSVDLSARVLAQRLSEALGQPVVIDNRAGGGGAVGLDAMVKSAADGYTLAVAATGAITINPHLVKLSYDTLKELAPVAMLASSPLLLAVNATLPVRTVRELVAYAKTQPSAMSFAVSGVGSLAYLSGEQFKRATGIDLVAVPYKGGAPAAAAIAAGEVPAGITDVASLTPFVKSGRIRGLGITDPKRSPSLPEYPTIAEAGVPGFETYSWLALFAPANVPADIITRLNTEVVKVLGLAEVRDQYARAALDPTPSTAAELGRIVRAESEKWRNLIREAGIKGE